MVIVAGRYGSIGPDGWSYTEMEYRYAQDSGKPVLGFLHRDPTSLLASKCEGTDEGKAKLKTFREFLQKKMCRFWESPPDLGSQVSRSLVKLIKSHPGIGWVRANLVPDESATKESLINKLNAESRFTGRRESRDEIASAVIHRQIPSFYALMIRFAGYFRIQDGLRVSNANNDFLAMTRLARPNRLNNCAWFLASPL